MNRLKIGLLDFGNGYESFSDFIEVATGAEKLGFSRLWLGEHYVFNHLWCNPEVLIPLVLGYTERIRVGCAGILLNVHTPYRVALSFKLANNLFAERVDLGLAAGWPGIEKVKTLMLEGRAPAADFDARIEELVTLLRNEEGTAQDGLPLPPYRGGIPEIWSLGSSDRRLPQALSLGLGFSRSIFHGTPDIACFTKQLPAYRAAFLAQYGRPPNVNIAFSGVCDTTQAGAERIYRQSPYYNASFIQCNLAGTPEAFHDMIAGMREHSGIDEFIFLNLANAVEDKLRAMRLLSERFELCG